MKIARTIKRNIEQRIAETYAGISKAIGLYDLEKEDRKVGNFYKHGKYMDTITTPNEVIEWTQKNKCPVCQQCNYNTDLTWDYEEFYRSEIWCNSEPVNHYWVSIKFEDPKNLLIGEQSFSIGENGTDVEFYYADCSTKLVDVRIRWKDWDDKGWDTEKVISIGPQILDPDKFNEEEWVKTVEIIKFFR